MEDEVQMKNIREFLQSYNKIADDCFSQCVYTLSHSRLTDEEMLCANNCVQKSKFVDQKCMQAFIEHQQLSVQKLMEETAVKQAEQEVTVGSNDPVPESKKVVEQNTTDAETK